MQRQMNKSTSEEEQNLPQSPWAQVPSASSRARSPTMTDCLPTSPLFLKPSPVFMFSHDTGILEMLNLLLNHLLL